MGRLKFKVGDVWVTLPSLKGDKGDKGDQGIQGIQGDQGIQGIKGDPGTSAYAAAVAGGFTGTEAEFNAALANAPLLTYLAGYNSVTTLTDLPVNKRSVVATLSANSTLSLASSMAQGRELHIKVYNSTAAEITITMPTSTPYESTGNDGVDISSVTIPANGNIEISIWAVNNKQIITTNA